MDEPHLLYEVAGGVATITLNRPRTRNAMTPEMLIRLGRAWADVRDDPAVSVVLLRGAGEDSFCSGADLGRLIPLMTGARGAEDEWDEQYLADPDTLSKGLLRGFDVFKPIVAGICGPALAGGTEVLMGTDFRIASERAVFGTTEVRRGIIPAGGTLVRLARQIPYTAAMQIILGGEPVSAEFALRWGLVSRVVPHADTLPVAKDTAQWVAEAAPKALALAKEVVVRTSGLPFEQAYPIEAAAMEAVMATEDAREGPLAFLEKRPPVWQGR
ncbi:MAG: enoyl-CoA hydratase/isomerase family protein [Acidimicrobiales bacterium]|nr:enoyl-CoA hydratase/isomerase family protein [Acidimicrobiales bacterium]